MLCIFIEAFCRNCQDETCVWQLKLILSSEDDVQPYTV